MAAAAMDFAAATGMAETMDSALYLVTVTYGSRGHFLAEVVRRCCQETCLRKIVVVSNASSSPLETLLQPWRDRIVLIENDRNTGSAAAYALGIQSALADGAGYLLLMDDDTAPMPGCISSLLAQVKSLAQEVGADRAAVAGFRPSLQPDLAAGKPPPLPSSFLGFHLAQIPQKIWSRVRPRAKARATLAGTVDLPFAAYGGLLAHRSLFEALGLPNQALFLYEDDTEYTFRLTSRGGIIRLFTQCVIEDLETSWNTKGAAGTAAARLTAPGEDFRIFYSVRNRTWFDCTCYAQNRAVFHLNMLMYMSMIVFQACRRKRLARLRVILRAVADGYRGRLGAFPSYPLPGQLTSEETALLEPLQIPLPKKAQSALP